MSKYNRFDFTPRHEAELREFWPTNKPLRLLSASWGVSTAYVSIKAKELGMTPRTLRMYEIRCANHPSSPEQNAYLREQAALREISVEELQARLIRTIVRDRLVVAILDDDHRKAA